MNSNLSAFLRVIREGESSQDDAAYRMLYGGGLFDSFAAHPNTLVTAAGHTSTAAGAYQFLNRTWKSLANKFGYTDFAPVTQDAGAIQLIRGRGAYNDIVAGRFETAILKCNKEWASLPGSPYGQRTLAMARCKKVYEEYGGSYESTGEMETVEAKEKPMGSIFLDAALSVLSSKIPEIGKLFGGSQVAERNTKAAEIVVSIAKEAVGAKNEQELIDDIKANPETVKAVEKAIQDNWFQIQEAGGGGIVGAAQRSLMLQDSPAPLYKNGAFIITMLLMPLVYVTVYAVYWGADMPPDLKTMTVTAIVTGVLAGIMGYWMGTSFGSGRKTDMLAAKLK